MIYKKKLVLVISVLALILNTSFGQSAYTPFTPKIIPPSPNAASLQKFGDIPVSPYTGTTDVSVPIYTIQARGVSVPITLDYHTGGIRLSEEAGWVGLGWALNAGGMISRTVNDKDDFVGGYFNSSLTYPMPEAKGRLLPYTLYPTQPYLGNWGYEFACNYKVHTELGDVDYLSAFKQAFISAGSYDFEPDSYSFNFLGRSGKFIIGRDGKVILQKQENLKIEFATDGTSFTITDEQGTKYYFLDKEYSEPTTGGAQAVSAWMLSKIITQQKDSVIFNYASASTWSTVKGIAHETYRTGVTDETPIYSNDAGTNYLNKTLQNIDYDNCQVQFAFDDSRADLEGGKKLNKIKIYSKVKNVLTYIKEDNLYYSYFNEGFGDQLEFARLRLDSVQEVSGKTSIPPYKFTYNLQPNNQNLMGKHYSSVDHWGYFNGASNAIYGNYTLGFTPPFYGIATLHGIGQLVILSGANREPDASFMQTFSLNKVTYPTGGSTVFEYEPNYYDHANSISGSGGRDYEYVALQTQVIQIPITARGSSSGTVDLSDIYFTSSSTSNATMSIGFVAAGSDSLNYYHNVLSFGKINFTFQGDISDITDASLYCSGTKSGNTCSGTTYSAARSLIIPSPTTYNWSAYIDPSVTTGFSQIEVTITYQSPVFRHSTMLMAGGLRIKSIKDYSFDGKLAKKRTYDYTYQQDKDGSGIKTYSYGKLMGYLSYARNEIITSSTWPNYSTSLTRYSSSFSAFTSQSSGNIVGYDQVAEYTVDSASGLDNGKTVYTFNNSSDTTFTYAGYRFPGVQNLPNNLNGLPKSKSVFSRVGTGYNKVSTTDYYYHSANRIIYDAFKWFHYYASAFGARNDPNTPQPCTDDTHGVPITTGCNCPTQVDTAGYQLTTNFYPAISSEVILLDSTIEKKYDQNDTTKQEIAVTRNYYDNPVHYQTTRTSSVSSNGDTITKLIRYPQDYITSGGITGNSILDTMISHNMVASVIETRDSLTKQGTSAKYVTGALLTTFRTIPGRIIMPFKIYHLSISQPVTDFQPYAISGSTTTKDNRYDLEATLNYDINSNISEVDPKSGINTAYLWDYQNTLPVAKIAYGSTFLSDSTNYAYSSFETDSTGNWSFTPAIKTDATAPTGNRVDDISTSPYYIHIHGLNPDSTYIVSYWSRNTVAFAISGSQVTTGLVANKWHYYEHKVTNKSSLAIGMPTSGGNGSGRIDELRLYPLGAQMTTYAYTPVVGMTSQNDQNNNITYYEYDAIGRLVTIRDQYRNIIKKYDYNYAHQKFNPNKFYNKAQTNAFVKNDCSDTSRVGTEALDSIDAGVIFSDISQPNADSIATDYLDSTGQTDANVNGACVLPVILALVNYDHITDFSLTLTDVYDSTRSFTIPFPVDSATTTAKIPPARYNITISKPGNTDSHVFTASGPGGSIQVNSVAGSWSNVYVNTDIFNKLTIGIP